MATLEKRLQFEYGGQSWFTRTPQSELNTLFSNYGSDKGSSPHYDPVYPWAPHTYGEVYASLFDHCRLSVRSVFECGVGTNNPKIESNMGAEGRPGASLRAWRDYFPNAQVVGVDIDPCVMFEENRIKTFQLDQRDPSDIRTFWAASIFEPFDLFIDDGLHTYSAGLTLFENSWEQLAPFGIYVIEDVSFHDLPKYIRYFHEKNLWVSYVLMWRRNSIDNNLIIVRNSNR